MLFTRVPNELVGGELIWGRRTNNSDGFHSDGVHLQFWFKYSFSLKLGGQSWLEMKTLASAGRLAVAALGAAAAIGAQSAGSQQAVEQQQGGQYGPETRRGVTARALGRCR